MDFNAVVLAQLESIVASQSRVLESQLRLTRTVESLGERLQVAGTPASSILLHPDCLGSNVAELCDSPGSGKCSIDENLAWPANIQARISEQDMVVPQTHVKTDLTGTTVVRKSGSRRTRSYATGAQCVILPESSLQAVLDIVGVLFSVGDLLTTSLVLAWGLQENNNFWVGACISPPFWTFDILKHFLMAFYQEGMLLTGLMTIAISYLKTYFFIDLCLVVLDWGILALLILNYSDMQTMTLIRVLQLLKLIRVIQSFRMLSRLLGRWNLYAERKFSERNRLIMSHLVVPSLYIVCGLHFLACLFYYVGAAKLGSHSSSFFENLDHVDAGFVFVESSLVNQYLTVFHCATASVSLAGNFEAPMSNAFERMVMIFALLVGFIFGSVFISSTSAAIVDHQTKQHANSARLRKLRKYLCENAVRLEVYQRVVKQAEQRLLASDRLKEEDVDAFAFLSKQFILEVRVEIQWPPLQQHPLFRLLQMLDGEVPRRLCNECLSSVHLSVGDELFRERDMAEKAYILTFGELRYRQTPQMSRVEYTYDIMVDPGEWLSEAALFSIWVHVGLARATLSSRLLAINAAALTKTVLHYEPAVRAIAVEYGGEFHRRIVVSAPGHSWPNDLFVASTDYCEIVLALSVECQVEIGKCATRALPRTDADALLDEIRMSKAVIILNRDGEVYRFKSILVLRVEQRENEAFLVQIGKAKGKAASPSVMLPGCTLERGELICDCVERLLRTKFGFLVGKIDVLSENSEVIEGTSKDFAVQTRYCRNEVHCKVQCDDDLVLPAGAANPYLFASHQSFVSMRYSSSDSRLDKEQSHLARLHFVVAWDHNDNGTIYAWLSQNDFDYLRSAAGSEWLRSWLLLRDFKPPQISEY